MFILIDDCLVIACECYHCLVTVVIVDRGCYYCYHYCCCYVILVGRSLMSRPFWTGIAVIAKAGSSDAANSNLDVAVVFCL